jgi:hypothetical protein
MGVRQVSHINGIPEVDGKVSGFHNGGGFTFWSSETSHCLSQLQRKLRSRYLHLQATISNLNGTVTKLSKIKCQDIWEGKTDTKEPRGKSSLRKPSRRKNNIKMHTKDTVHSMVQDKVK